jgi:hypothetical protein
MISNFEARNPKQSQMSKIQNDLKPQIVIANEVQQSHEIAASSRIVMIPRNDSFLV